MKLRSLIFGVVLFVLPAHASQVACQETASSVLPAVELAPADGVAVAKSSVATRSEDSGRRDLPEEGLQFIRTIALLLLPPKFEDDDGWGKETRVQSGLNVDIEDGRLRTSRRWKSVNHGSWLQGSGELVNPEKTFTLKAAILPDAGDKTQRYDIRVSTRLFVTGRQQQWNYGVMLWSLSADAIADVSLHVVLEVTSEVLTTDRGIRLRFQPHVTHAAASLDGFSLRRVSHARGAAVREFGELLERLIKTRIKRENRELATRINQAIRKKADQLEIPMNVGGWLGLRGDGATGQESNSPPTPVPDKSSHGQSAPESPTGESGPRL